MSGQALAPSARHIAARAFEGYLRPGDTAVDATLGRGRDCARLCELVGETGRVFGFDVQPQALEETRALLAQRGLLPRAGLFLMGHERMAEVVPPGVRLAAFNLGWLPGHDKRLTTRTDTTLRAVEAALALLAPGGALVACCYPGHPEGKREQDAVEAFAQGLPPSRYLALFHHFVNGGPGAPSCLVVEKLGPAA